MALNLWSTNYEITYYNCFTLEKTATQIDYWIIAIWENMSDLTCIPQTCTCRQIKWKKYFSKNWIR